MKDHSTLMLLGVDIGTTHVKACAYGEDGRFLGSSRRGTPSARLQGGGAEYDAHALEHAVFEVIRHAAERFGPPRAIGVASMAESGFLVDDSGEPLAPAVAWFDERTAPQAARWKERLDPLELLCRTGCEQECVACGASMLAGIGAGIFEGHNSVPGPEYEPYTHDPAGDQAAYGRLYSEVLRPLRERLGSLRPARQTAGWPGDAEGC